MVSPLLVILGVSHNLQRDIVARGFVWLALASPSWKEDGSNARDACFSDSDHANFNCNVSHILLTLVGTGEYQTPNRSKFTSHNRQQQLSLAKTKTAEQGNDKLPSSDRSLTVSHSKQRHSISALIASTGSSSSTSVADVTFFSVGFSFGT